MTHNKSQVAFASSIAANALSKASILVGSRTGIIEGVYLAERGPDDPNVFHATARPADITPFNCVPASNLGTGCGLQKETALMRAIGECVERYCGAIYQPEDFRLCSFDKLAADGYHSVNPSHFCLFSEEQYARTGFPFKPLGCKTDLAWVHGYSVTRRRDAFLPAASVYVPFDFSVESDTRPSHMPISTGLAAGPNVLYATLKGIFEIVERDAFMVYWHRRLPLIHVDPNTIQHTIAPLLKACESTGARWFLHRLPCQFSLPVIMAILINDRGAPKLCFGCSAGLSLEAAATQAMEECMLTRFYVNHLLSTGKCKQLAYSDVRTLSDHAAIYATSSELKENLLSWDTVEQGPQNASLGPRTDCLENAVTDIVHELAEHGFEVFVADLTTPDVATAGFRVIRVVIPGMQPLDNDHCFPHAGCRRLRTAPHAIGMLPKDESMINLIPHPFP